MKDAFGSAVHDVEAFGLAQLAGVKRQDSLVFKQARKGIPEFSNGGAFFIDGPGTKGDYKTRLAPYDYGLGVLLEV